MAQLTFVGHDQLLFHTIHNSKIFLFGRGPDGHTENILESAGIVEDYDKQMLEELPHVCIRQAGSGYSHAFALVHRTRNCVGYMTM